MTRPTTSSSGFGFLIILLAVLFLFGSSDSNKTSAFLVASAPSFYPQHAQSFSSLSTTTTTTTQLRGGGDGDDKQIEISEFDKAVLNRDSCKQFRRADGTASGTGEPSRSDPTIIQKALYCLELARQSPSAFNTQPYKLLMVHSHDQKLRISKHCLGPNADRVLDSDCTVVFLADRQVMKSLPRFRKLLASQLEREGTELNLKALRTTQLYIGIFSSGYPVPRVISSTVSFFFRTAISFLNALISWFYPLPTLASSETWSAKQTLMVAMTYMLACSSRGIATIPMEVRKKY